MAAACFFPAWALDAEVNKTSPFRLQHSVQTGLEYDSNVYRTFQAKRDDILLRALLKQKGTYAFHDRAQLGWIYQLGGKKYFEESGQDTLIQSLEVPLMVNLTDVLGLGLTQDFKLQLEDGDVDAAAGDVNEDYLSYSVRFHPRLSPREWTWLRIEPSGSFSYFDFSPAPNFSFMRQSLGLRLQYNLGSQVSATTSYSYSLQQFYNTNRDDSDHLVSVGLARLGDLYSSISYAYEANRSSLTGFSFDRHQIATVLSYTFGQHGSTQGEAQEGRYGIHLLGTLQLRSLPAVYNFDAEGQRFLLTGAEDENFNSLVLKLTYHLRHYLAFEGKITRYSNEFSKLQGGFARVMAYLGVRGSF